MDCGCGRSPTGKCIGWHKLSEEEYAEALKKYKAKELDGGPWHSLTNPITGREIVIKDVIADAI